MSGWHAHLNCGCWVEFSTKPERGRMVVCGMHGWQPVMSMFERDEGAQP